MRAGFRESGINIGQKKILVAVRTTAFGLEVPLAKGSSMLCFDEALDVFVAEANTRLLANFARTDRFFGLVKEHFGWPFISAIRRFAPLQRWGHVVVDQAGDAMTFVVSGGYGVNTQSDSPLKCSRELPLLSVDAELLDFKTFQCSSFPSRMHAAGAEWSFPSSSSGQALSGVFLLGGRESPNNCCSPLLQVLQYLHEKQQYISHEIDIVGDSPSLRWGHSVTRIRENAYFVFGGRDDRRVFNDAFVLTLLQVRFEAESKAMRSSWSWEKLIFDEGPNIPSGLYFHAACYVSGHCMEVVNPFAVAQDEAETPAIVIHGGVMTIEGLKCSGDFFFYYPLQRAWSSRRCRVSSAPGGNADEDAEDTCKFYMPTTCHRFGHTLTNIGFKTLMLVGGTNFEETKERREPIMIFDYEMSRYGSIEVSFRPGHFPESLIANIPCADCRVHHQVVSQHAKDGLQQMILTGGGATCLAFGPHFCESVTFDLTLKSNSSSTSSSAVKSMVKVENAGDGIEKIRTILGNHEECAKASVLLVSKDRVKSVKILLEKNGWIDKSVRITSYENVPGAPGILMLNLDGSGGNEMVLGLNDCNSVMAVPITPSFEKKLLERTLSPADVGLVKSALSSHILYISTQACSKSKAESLSPYSLLSVFLDTFSEHFGIPRSALDEKGVMTPVHGGKVKFETVGDILVIPEDILCVEPWMSADEGSKDEKRMFSELLLGLATCFCATRVARKARVDCGPKRESKVRLLLPPAGMSKETGSGSPGWVTVIENSIHFSFDITRVMFCSGNCTERMRMARVQAKDEIIVDLYSGVGYYTIPFLVHSKAAFVHACEWNENSVIALKHNLKAAGIDRHCKIHFGDNRKEETVNALSGLADRVCLGLLPSSKDGWPLAVNALKPSGGVLHVHENVKVSELETWVQFLCEYMEKMFKDSNKSMSVKCVHLEKVKSYAPKILHVVADLMCTRIS